MLDYRSFLEKVGPMSSDHAMQGIRVNTDDFTLHGFTHNTLDKMHDKAHCPSRMAVDAGTPYNNNPLDHQESPSEYLARKKQQLDFYRDRLGDSILSYDFIFLQEVDLFFDKKPSKETAALLEEFKQYLALRSWGLIQTTNERTGKRLVTLYSKRALEPVSTHGVFKDNSGKKDTALGSVFKHKFTGREIVLTNVHLDYKKSGEAYSSEISRYMAEHTAQGRLVIVGGDTNHPREHLPHAIGSREFATSFEADQNNAGQFSLQYRLDPTCKSAIDTFMVIQGPSTTATPVDCSIFTDSLEIKPLPSAMSHSAAASSSSSSATSSSVPTLLPRPAAAPALLPRPAAAPALLPRPAAAPALLPRPAAAPALLPRPAVVAPSYERAVAASSSPVAPLRRPDLTNFSGAINYILPEINEGKVLKVRYAEGKFLVAIFHNGKKNTIDAANNTLNKFNAQLVTHGFQSEAFVRNIEEVSIEGKKYRALTLTDLEAAELVEYCEYCKNTASPRLGST